MNKLFLGIYIGHNASASIVDDKGNILDALNEERFVNIKNYTGFPEKSVKYLMNKYKNFEIVEVSFPMVEYTPLLVNNSNPRNKNKNKFISILLHLQLFILMYFRGLYNFVYSVYSKKFKTRYLNDYFARVSKMLKIDREKIKGYEHHLCHANTAYHLSSFNNEKSLILTLDGEGDGLCATVNIGENGSIRRVSETKLGNSIGYMYMALTQYLGMKPLEHEYKIMGLAPYVKEKNYLEIYEIIKNWIWVEGLEFKSKFDTRITLHMIRRNLYKYRFDNLSAAFQKLTEDLLTEWVINCMNEFKIYNVCLSGGVFMNVKANLKISKIPKLKKLWVMPSCGDESLSIGCALESYKNYCIENSLKVDIKKLSNLYLGPSYSNDDIEKELKLKKYSGLKYKKTSKIEKEIADLLVKGEVVAHFYERMEFGARALGNRSILANPIKPLIIKEINEYIKNRDFWMPFAGSILEEYEKDFIINPKNICAKYMVMAFDSTKFAQEKFINAMHQYDFTIRPQVVSKKDNFRYYEIIKNFYKKTEIAGVLNTSFNLHGYPIVMTPKQALNVFLKSGIKYLVIEDYLISKT